jgi:hypothetical protein
MNMKKLVLIAVYLLLVTNVASAQGLVPCSGLDCDLCDLLVLFKNVITFMTQLTVVLAGLFFAWGSFGILTAGDSREKVDQGRKTMTIAATGVLIAFTAYLIVGTALQIFTDSPSKLPWTQIQCVATK